MTPEEEEKILDLTERSYSPVGIIPPDLLGRFNEREEEALQESARWIERNGAIILRVRKMIPSVDNRVYLSSDAMIRARATRTPNNQHIREEFKVYFGEIPARWNTYFLALILKYSTQAEGWEYNSKRAGDARNIIQPSLWRQPMSTEYQDKITAMAKTLEEALTDAKKIDEKNVKTARTRLRKSLQAIINESKDFRKTILNDAKE